MRRAQTQALTDIFREIEALHQINWHRLFRLILIDLFTNSPYEVELEKDLSIKQQFLDVVIIRKMQGEFTGRLPDGLHDLVDHNLISFKSHREAFDAWTMKELIGHYVNYRKQASPSLDDLLPEEHFRLYGVTAHFPSQLASQVELAELQAGVYQCRWGVDDVRIIVLRDLPEEEHNAPLHLFSAVREHVQYAQAHYQQRSLRTSREIRSLLAGYEQEGIPVPYTMEDFDRELRERAFELVTVDDLLQRLPEQILEDLLEKLPSQKLEEVLEKLPSQKLEEVLEKLPADERLKGLSPKEIEQYLKKVKNDRPESG